MIINHLHLDACRYGCKILPEEMPDDNKMIHLEKQIKDLSFKLKDQEMISDNILRSYQAKLNDKDKEINKLKESK